MMTDIDYESLWKERVAERKDKGEEETGRAQTQRLPSIPSRRIALSLKEAPKLQEAQVDDFISFFSSGTIREVKEDESGKKFIIEMEQIDILDRKQVAGA